MDLRTLDYFLMTAREENITRAAQLLHITQPTLSRQLAQLEGELGVKLFRRSNHSIRLTDEGMLFRRRAQEIVELAQVAKGELSPDEGPLSGRVRIGCGELQSMDELARIIEGFCRENPLVGFDLRSGYNDDIKAWMDRGLVDLGLLIEPVDVRTYGFVRMKREERWGVLVREDSPLAALEAITSEDLAGTRLVGVADEPVRSELSSWSGNAAFEMIPVLTYNLLYNAAIAVRNGIGAAMCIDLDARYEGLRFVPLQPPLEFSSVLAWKDGQPLSRTTEAFIAYSKKCI